MHYSNKPLHKTPLFLLFVALVFGFSPIKGFSQADDVGFHIGGAVRYNILLQNYHDFGDDEITVNDGQFTWDTWRLNVTGKNAAGVQLSFEYRFYPTFGTHFIHHGWVGYEFNDMNAIQLGVTQVPFGDLTYASHSWWFITPYYVGLEDDYDMGLKYLHKNGNLDLQFAYFFSPEPAGPAPTPIEKWPSYGVGGSGRYSYDIIPNSGAHNQERNQFNGRIAYALGATEVGFSAQYGQLYNSVLEEWGSHVALGLHTDANVNRFNIKASVITYSHDAKNDDGSDAELVHMGAYGSGTYPVAAEATMYTLGIAYSLPVQWGPISNLTFYNDYTLTKKSNDAFHDTQQDILGVMVTAGSVYTYFDIANGQNQPWLTNRFGTGLGEGLEDAKWNTRFNINIGYYF